MHQGHPHFKLYSSTASQWAGVPLLGIAEKEYPKDSYEIQDIDLLGAGNFDPSYIKINKNGTIPSLKSDTLASPLIESADILEWLDQNSHSGPQLAHKIPTRVKKSSKPWI